MAIDVSNLLEIRTRVLVGSAPSGAFGRGLVLTTEAALPAGGPTKAQLFDSLSDAEDVLPEGPARSEFEAWFGAGSPHGLYVARWATADVATSLTGAEPDALADLQAANAAFTLNGNDVVADTSAAADFAAVATAIQTAVQALPGFSGATFAYTNNRFVLTLAGAGEIEGGALGDTDGSHTQIAAHLGMDAGSADRDYLRGHDQESVRAAVTEILDLTTGQRPEVVILATDAPLTDPVTGTDTREELSAMAESTDSFVLIVQDAAAQTLVPNDSTSLGAAIFAAQRGNTAFCYGAADSRLPAGLGGFLSSQDFSEPNSIESVHSETLPGVAVSALTGTQLNELERKRINVNVRVGSEASVLGGYTSKNAFWLDNVWWLRWFRSRLRGQVWAAQKGSKRFTNGQLYDALLAVAEEGVRSGGIQPGRQANAAMLADIRAVTGNRNFDGRMENGYVIWVNAARSEQMVDARDGQFRLWATGAAALHFIDGEIAFQN